MWKSALTLLAAALLPLGSQAIEILEADPGLSARIAGDPHIDTEFGTPYFHDPHPGTYLLGSFYEPESREAVMVLGFRVTPAFLREWEEQGQAQLLFSIINFASWDPRRICPIHVELLDSNHSTAINAASRSPQPRPRLGSISRDELEINRLYRFPLPFDPSLKADDLLWIGLDCTNPLDPMGHSLILSGDLHLYPGGAPPILIAGSPDATTKTAHGMSLLQSLNRRFSTPEHIEEMTDADSGIPSWVNPFRTTRNLKTLDEFRLTLEQQLSKLPDCPLVPSDRFAGFHSSIKSTNETWTIRIPVQGKETSISLYPAVRWNRHDPEVYAFPKRFTITAFPYERNHRPVIVADWSHRDFPLNGPNPVMFPFRWNNYREIRITVQQGMPVPGGHVFALSEIALSKIDDTEPTDLLAAPADVLDAPPFWSPAYATDGQTAFGIPMAATKTKEGTFKTLLQENGTPQIIIRQREITSWDSLEFYPTALADGTPPQGFPQGIQIEFSNQDNFSQIIRTLHSSGETTARNARRPYVFQFPKVNARNVRITLDPAQNSPEGRLLQLEEITVNGGIPLSERRKGIHIEFLGGADSPDPRALYDRVINGQPWNTSLRRTVDQIRRQVLSNELKQVGDAMQALRQAHRHTMTAIQAGGIIVAISLFGGILFYQRRQAGRTQQRIRLRIQQDLHDEIGSQLSAISLIADMDRDAPELTSQLRTDLNDINQSAREAIASLAEVIWLTDKEILTLSQCFDVMRKRAVQMVHTIKLELDFPQQVPDFQLSFKNKRNMILLFTEALNNALKHSNADTILAGATLNGRDLTLYVNDNGQGFSPKTTHGCIGLKSMKDRAFAMGGTLEIISSPGTGTTVQFRGTLSHKRKIES